MSEPRELLLQNLPEIERIITSMCRRKGMNTDATEEFAAEVKLRLVDDDYAIIRAFQKRSSFLVFIAAVVRRLLLDDQNREWGKWRTSAEAERLGPLATNLERLLYRDRRTIEEALTLLVSTYPRVTKEELERLAVRLPPRVPRRKVDLEEATSLAAPEHGIDAIRKDTARRLSDAVTSFIDQLPEDDQLILRLRFHSNMTVAQIARALHVDQQLLYRRMYKHFEDLREELGRTGIAAADVEELIGADTSFLDFRLKNRGLRPSEEEESAVAARREEMS